MCALNLFRTSHKTRCRFGYMCILAILVHRIAEVPNWGATIFFQCFCHKPLEQPWTTTTYFCLDNAGKLQCEIILCALWRVIKVPLTLSTGVDLRAPLFFPSVKYKYRRSWFSLRNKMNVIMIVICREVILKTALRSAVCFLFGLMVCCMKMTCTRFGFSSSVFFVSYRFIEDPQ